MEISDLAGSEISLPLHQKRKRMTAERKCVAVSTRNEKWKLYFDDLAEKFSYEKWLRSKLAVSQ